MWLFLVPKGDAGVAIPALVGMPVLNACDDRVVEIDGICDMKAIHDMRTGPILVALLRVSDEWIVVSSVITLKPAIRYHFKTGQRDWPKT